METIHKNMDLSFPFQEIFINCISSNLDSYIWTFIEMSYDGNAMKKV